MAEIDYLEQKRQMKEKFVTMSNEKKVQYLKDLESEIDAIRFVKMKIDNLFASLLSERSLIKVVLKELLK